MSNITAKPLKPQDLDVNNLSFASVRTMPNGAKIVYVNHKSGMLYLQSPELSITMDTGNYFPDQTDNSGKFSIRTSLENYNVDGPVKTFHDTLKSLDEHLIKKAVECSGEWFENLKWFKKKGLSVEEKVTDNYTPIMKLSLDSETGEPDGKWPPSFSFKVVRRENKFLCDCFDSDKKEINTQCTPEEFDEQFKETFVGMFKKGTTVKTIVKCNGVWISNVGWGCTWKVEQIRINTPKGFSGYSFEDTDDEDSDEGVPLTRTDTVAKPEPDNLVESDEDSGEEEEEDEEEAVVKRKVKK